MTGLIRSLSSENIEEISEKSKGTEVDTINIRMNAIFKRTKSVRYTKSNFRPKGTDEHLIHDYHVKNEEDESE